MTVDIRRADPRDFVLFLQASDAYAASLYPAESNHMLDVDSLRQPDVLFFGCFFEHQPSGCGAIAVRDSYVEIKRVWVDPLFRGRGLSKRLMLQLEEEAIRLRIHTARLETGIHQSEALGLYRSIGYLECAPFGSYQADPLSVFMEKPLR